MTPRGGGGERGDGDSRLVHPVSVFPLAPESGETCRSCAYAGREHADDVESPIRCLASRRELFRRVAARDSGWEAAAAGLVDQRHTLWGHANTATDYPSCTMWASREAEAVLVALTQQRFDTLHAVDVPRLF